MVLKLVRLHDGGFPEPSCGIIALSVSSTQLGRANIGRTAEKVSRKHCIVSLDRGRVRLEPLKPVWVQRQGSDIEVCKEGGEMQVVHARVAVFT